MMWVAIKVLKIVSAMGVWYWIWSWRPRPLWPLIVIACIWVPSFISRADWSGPVNLTVDAMFVWALWYFDGNRWNRLKRKAKNAISQMTEVARASFARQVKEAS